MEPTGVVLWMALVTGQWPIVGKWPTEEACRAAVIEKMNAMEPAKRSQWACRPFEEMQLNSKSAESLEIQKPAKNAFMCGFNLFWHRDCNGNNL